jgi:DNA-damage-inducible protein J
LAVNVLALKWEEIDFTLGTWRIPRTKSGDSQTLPLTRLALEVLVRRHEEADEDAEWVFPGNGSTGHLVEPKRQWQLLLESAGLADLRMHDLQKWTLALVSQMRYND